MGGLITGIASSTCWSPLFSQSTIGCAWCRCERIPGIPTYEVFHPVIGVVFAITSTLGKHHEFAISELAIVQNDESSKLCCAILGAAIQDPFVPRFRGPKRQIRGSFDYTVRIPRISKQELLDQKACRLKRLGRSVVRSVPSTNASATNKV